MSANYLRTALMGSSNSHTWSKWLMPDGPACWWVHGFHEFTRSGWAVVDDFGFLREVPQ